MPSIPRTYFFGQDHPLSNWHPAPFLVKGVRFAHVEQFMMYCKARLFKDIETADKILAQTDPKECKRLGRTVRGFVDEVWNSKREIYVEKGCFAKFSQNPHTMDFLLATEGTELVEASRYDTIWGAGLAQTDPRIEDASNWPGLNLLGKVLERVRARLLAAKLAAQDPKSLRHFHADKTLPQAGEIFVFGSNLAGRHGKGSALAAREQFGAIYGQAEGRQGQAYAIATKDGRPGTPPLSDPRATLSLELIQKSVEVFITYAKEHPHERFFIVRLGCDLAGWKDSDIAPMFQDAPPNCSLPEPWQRFFEASTAHGLRVPHMVRKPDPQ